jgi:Raf kinase inhibitor-like YbhB/YbcL family protein
MEVVKMTLSLTSSVFNEGERIPVKYTCQGQDISPQLHWNGVPEGSKSLALIMDDPDAPGGVFTHWVIFNLPANNQGLPEAITSAPQLSDGSLQGRNDFGRTGYGGPCPPPGKPHRYRFALYALDKKLDLGAGSSKNQVLNAVEGHILAHVQLTGIYQR